MALSFFVVGFFGSVEEGFPERYAGTDIDPMAGVFLQGVYSDVGEIHYGYCRGSVQNFV